MASSPFFFFLLLLLLSPCPARADVDFFSATSNALLLSDPTSYTPEMGSVQNFATQTRLPVVYYDTICDGSVLDNVPANTIVAFSSDNCDVGKTLIFLRMANVQVALELFGAHQISTEPLDSAPRYAYDPNPQTIILNRVHGPVANQVYNFFSH